MRPEAPVLILDGGLGTTLEDKYHVRFSSAATPLWSSHLLVADQPTLLACHEDFAAAGADIVCTATYQASAAGFAATRAPPDWPAGVPLPRVPELLADAAALARMAVGAGTGGGAGRVALALGPYGATVVPSQEYGGRYDAEHCGVSALVAWHLERMLLFAKAPGLVGRVDYVAFETVPRLDEVVAVRQVMDDRGLCGGLPFWISCVFPGEDDVLALPDGTPVEEVVRAMLTLEVSDVVPWGIGINCTKVTKLPRLVEHYEVVVRHMVASGELSGWPSLVLYPDGTNGEVYNTTTQKWEVPEDKEAPKISWESQVAEVVRATQRRGRWNSIVVGGCCKTSPDDIARLRAAVLTPQAVDQISDEDHT